MAPDTGVSLFLNGAPVLADSLPKPGIRQDVRKMADVFAEHGVVRATRAENAKVMGLRMQDLVEATVTCLEEDIGYLSAK